MEHVFLITQQIADACKIPVKFIGKYVKEHGLPAFKDSDAENAPWKARPEALKKWAEDHEKKYLKKSCQ